MRDHATSLLPFRNVCMSVAGWYCVSELTISSACPALTTCFAILRWVRMSYVNSILRSVPVGVSPVSPSGSGRLHFSSVKAEWMVCGTGECVKFLQLSP